MVDKVAGRQRHQSLWLPITGAVRRFHCKGQGTPRDCAALLGFAVPRPVKSQDTDAALDVIAPLVGPETVVVSLQNGMNPPPENGFARI